MECVPDASGAACLYCGRQKPAICKHFPRMNCYVGKGRSKGPGDYLHDLIKKWLSGNATFACGCKSKAAEMNRRGPQGCRDTLEEIVGWLVEQAKTHKWMDGKTPLKVRLVRWAMRRGVTKPVEIVCRWMVLAAIRKAEKATENCPAGKWPATCLPAATA
jgi:hypothetical protein